jgi:hypothetical protein
LASLIALQTRSREARRTIRFSMRSVFWAMGNLLVAN